jgi:RNA polymerase sigma-70 factor (ECF subfamily)
MRVDERADRLDHGASQAARIRYERPIDAKLHAWYAVPRGAGAPILGRCGETSGPAAGSPDEDKKRGRMTIAEQTDEALVKLVLNGDCESFAVLVDRYKRGITNFISASVRSPADVADLAQETFMRSYAHLGTFNPSLGKFSTWIYHIARNVVRTHLGKSLRRPQTQELGEDRSLEERLADTSPEAQPDRGILRAEAESDVRAALAELPERTRTVLSLRYYDNMEYQAIAETMGLSLGNVKTLIHRGKLALAQKMRAREQAASETVAEKRNPLGVPHALLVF